MQNIRRIRFQSRRCCSTPAAASLPDFSDKFFEDLKVSQVLSSLNRVFTFIGHSDTRVINVFIILLPIVSTILTT